MSDQNKIINTEAKADGSDNFEASPSIAKLSELQELHNSVKNDLDKNLEQNAPLEKFNDIIAILSACHLSKTA